MEKYIIEIRLGGTVSKTKFYFETLSECTNNQVMNVFVEHLTKDKAKAKRFYDMEEAIRFKALFNQGYGRTSQILTVKK